MVRAQKSFRIAVNYFIDEMAKNTFFGLIKTFFVNTINLKIKFYYSFSQFLSYNRMLNQINLLA